MRKKLMAMLLSFAMILTLLPTMAFATSGVTLQVDSSAENDNAVRADNARYQTLAGAYAKADAGDTIKLMSGITLADTVTINENLTIDLNGYTLTAPSNKDAIVCTAGTLTITGNDGTITGAGAGGSCVDANGSGAVINANGVTFEGPNAIAVQNSGTVNVTGGAIKTSSLYWTSAADGGTISVIGATVENPGKFSGSADLTNLTISGYVAKIDTAYYPTLAAAVAAAAANQTVKLLANITLTESVTVNKKITIDGKIDDSTNAKITMDAGDAAYQPIFNVTSGCTLQNIAFDYKGTGYDDCAVYLDSTVDGVVVDTCKFTGDATAAGIIGTYGVKNVTVKNSTFSTLKYGMYLNGVTGAEISDNIFGTIKYNAINIAGDNGTYPCDGITLNGNKLTNISTGDYDDDTYSAGISFGKFTTNAVIDKDKDGSVSMANDKKAVFAAEGAGVAIYGGVYSSNVGEYCADGKTAVDTKATDTPWHIETVSEFAGSGQKLIGGSTATGTDFSAQNGDDSSKISVEAFYADATEMSPEVQAAIAALPGTVIPIDVTLYYEDVAVDGAKLDNTIKVVIPFYGTAGTKYSVGHWNGTSFDIVPAEYDDVAHTLTFFAKEFSPYIIIDGVEYCKVYFNSGDGFAFKDFANVTAPLVGLAVKTADYSFKLDVDAGYTLVKVLNNGTELPLGTPTGTDAKTYSFQLVNVNDVRNIVAVVVKDEPVPAIMAKALEYTYADREAVGVSELTNGGYGVKYTIYRDELTLESGNVVMNDLARFFGALYRQDSNNGAKKITFNSVDYTWNTAGTLKGSNWKNGETSLVTAVVTEISELTNGATLSFKVDGEDVTLHLNILDRFTVGYDANEATGGAVPAAAAKYDKDATVTVLGNTNALVKTGYTFDGWNTKADGTGTSYAPGATFAATADVTLYAQWKADDTYTVTFDYTGVSAITGKAAGTEITVPSTPVSKPVDGDPFSKSIALVGWTCADVEGGKLLKPGAKFEMPAQNVTLNPVWGYRINFVMESDVTPLTEGGKYNTIVYGDAAGADAYKGYFGGRYGELSETVTLPADPTRTGYTFVGWENSVDGKTYTAGQQFCVTGDTVLTAQWTKNETKYTVTYDANSGTGAVPTEVAQLEGAVITLKESTLTRTGYTFTGWLSDQDHALYAPGTNYTMTAANTKFTAQWTANPTKYTVTYAANGGTGAVPTEVDQVVGAVITLKASTLAKTDATFIGWLSSADNAIYVPGANYTMTAANTTFTAQWKADDEYTVTYSNGTVTKSLAGKDVTVSGSGVTKPVVGDTIVTGKSVALLGWTCADVNGGMLLKPGTKFTMPAQNVVLNAEWAYRVNFNFNTELANISNLSTIGDAYNDDIVYGGTDPVYKAYYGGRFGEPKETVVLPADPTRTGYTFAGWKNSVDGETYFAGQQFFVTADTILTAQWTNAYTVVFDLNDLHGTVTHQSDNAVPANQSLDEGSLVTVPALTKTSYTYGGKTYYFNGWVNQKSGEKWYFEYDRVNADTANSGIVTLVAQWDIVKRYDVVFDDNLADPLDDYVTINGVVDLDGQYTVEDIASNEKINGKVIPHFERVGYTFAGWAMRSDYNNTTAEFDVNANIAACDPETWADESNVITVYAKWTCDYADPNAVTLPEQTMANGTYALYYSQYLVAVKTDSNNRVYRNFKLTDANGYDVVSSTVLPAGLYLNERTGEIYGVPTKVESKTFNVAVFDDEDNRISDVYKFTIEVKTLPLEVDAYTAMSKTYGDNDPIYQGAFLNYKLNGENMNVDAAEVDFDKTHVVVAPSTIDSTATFTYGYQAAYTSRSTNEATFTPVTASTLKYAPDLTNKIDGESVTVALNTMSKVDTVTADFERNTKYEDVGKYKLFLDAANLIGADDGYTLTVAPAFADKNLTYNEEEELTTTAKYLFTINAKSGLTYTVTKTYGQVKGGTVLTGEGEWVGLVNNEGILVVDDENTVKAVANLSPLSGAKFLKANTYTSALEYTLKNTVFDSTKDGSAAPAGTKIEATTDDYATPTLTLTINPLGLTVTGQTVNVNKGSAPTAANIAALAKLSGVLSGDTVTLTVASYGYDGGTYDNVDELITALDKISADKEVTVNFTTLSGDDAGNYSLTSGSVTGTLHAYTSGGSVGSGFVPTTYKVTCGTGVTADKKNATSGATITLTVAEGYEDVVVKDKDGKTVAVTEKNGKYTFKMPASDVTVSVDAAVDTVCIDFDDVVLDAWSHAGIHYCLENGMMNGVAADTFAPGAATTRAMIVTMLARLSGYKVNGAGNQWYVPSMEWAVANGVSDGTMMTANITREQFATMLYRYAREIAKIDTSKFTADTNTLSYDDVFSVSEWASEGVHFCLAAGIVTGYEDGTIRPQAEATRAEVAAMFQRFCVNVLGK